MLCELCNKEIPNDSKYCIHCGQSQSKHEKDKRIIKDYSNPGIERLHHQSDNQEPYKEIAEYPQDNNEKISFYWKASIVFIVLYFILYLVKGGALWSRLITALSLAAILDVIRSLIKKEKAQLLSWVLAIFYLILFAFNELMMSI